jgi:hypothetical protein
MQNLIARLHLFLGGINVRLADAEMAAAGRLKADVMAQLAGRRPPVRIMVNIWSSATVQCKKLLGLGEDQR